ncbi:hypothetical protein HDU77_009572 [Chytriomyces hyalinus]|nr:hypothetical protein HDU77_009572 [Chytriomyces hyalinus]
MKRQRTDSESTRNGATPAAASDAAPMAPAETNTATTLAIILRTLEKMQAQVTNIQETQQSLISAQRHLSNQVLDLQNRNKKFFTSLRDLPVEVIVRIFAWIPVRTVFKYRQLSRTINQCLLTSQFAVLNMQAAAFQKVSASTIGGLWLVVPQSYQAVVARAMAAQVKSIVGGDYGKVDYKQDDYGQFEKSLPKSISCLTAVEEIIVEGSKLLGVIPDVFGALKNLTTLRLRGNSLTGSLPSSLNLLYHLQFLDVADNQLSGDFPELPNLFALHSLCIGQNCFTGPVPTVFGDPRELIYFYAADNLFNVLPASIGQLTNLEELLISRNDFSYLESNKPEDRGNERVQVVGIPGREFPTREILNLENLEELHLVGNQFSGGEILDMTGRDEKITMCVDCDFQLTHVIREGFHKCFNKHGVTPYTGDISDSESEGSESKPGSEAESDSESEAESE